MSIFTIFLSGSVKKFFQESNVNKNYWTVESERTFQKTLLFPVKLLNPNEIVINQNDSESRFKADLKMLLESDLMIVDLESKKGIGVGSEMLLAKMHKIPVYSICPKESHYRKRVEVENNEWIHPFVYELSDKIFQSQMEVAEYLNELYEVNRVEIRQKINVEDELDKLSSFDAGYDEGYKAVKQFWGTKPADLVKKVVPMLKNENTTCLDLGCGHGKNSYFLENEGFQVTACDVSYYAIKEARNLNKNIKWLVRDLRKFNFYDKEFDLIVLTGSLHCLSTKKEVEQVVANVKKSTKIGGYNVISAFNNEVQDLSGHADDFHPILLKHQEYIKMYSDWKVVESTNEILQDISS